MPSSKSNLISLEKSKSAALIQIFFSTALAVFSRNPPYICENISCPGIFIGNKAKQVEFF